VNDLDPTYGAARAHWWGHYHGILAAFRGLMEYALAAEDFPMKSFVRDGYECAWQMICPELGMTGGLEGCVAGDLIALGIQLTDSGMGDYWDQVDAVTRNFLAEIQVTDIDGLRRISAAGPERPKDANWGPVGEHRFWGGLAHKSLPGMESNDNVLARNIGAIANYPFQGVRFQAPLQMACCTANGNQAFYYAWEAAVRAQGDTANVNLLFNRFSPWLDVESYLPYEGKVILRNKTVRKINVRIPAWVKRSTLHVEVDGKEVRPSWVGSYLTLDGLVPGRVVTIEFPMAMETRTLFIPAFNNDRPTKGTPKVTAVFKGSTCVEIKTPEEETPDIRPNLVPMFQREAYKQDQAPMKSVQPYVPERLVRWY
ncbi:MAG TPA: hypothetical protein VMY69_04690, partial [Phycisphaerae bacterium]|nr:hypothetical protein [Phycisphaerae bacterium]